MHCTERMRIYYFLNKQRAVKFPRHAMLNHVGIGLKLVKRFEIGTQPPRRRTEPPQTRCHIAKQTVRRVAQTNVGELMTQQRKTETARRMRGIMHGGFPIGAEVGRAEYHRAPPTDGRRHSGMDIDPDFPHAKRSTALTQQLSVVKKRKQIAKQKHECHEAVKKKQRFSHRERKRCFGCCRLCLLQTHPLHTLNGRRRRERSANCAFNVAEMRQHAVPFGQSQAKRRQQKAARHPQQQHRP